MADRSIIILAPAATALNGPPGASAATFVAAVTHVLPMQATPAAGSAPAGSSTPVASPSPSMNATQVMGMGKKAQGARNGECEMAQAPNG